VQGARIFASKDFDRFARGQRWPHDQLVGIVEEIEAGLIDGDMGSGIVKKRVAREGGSKASGFRLIVVFRLGERAVFVEGYAKNVKKKHTPQEIRALRLLAKVILSMPDEKLAMAIESGELREVVRHR
jgi:hypothetical protein